jgi:mRNA-degrading endonuclease RelE of RelBE toxin-antitoxin system
MQLRYKPKFWKDLNKLKKEKEVLIALGKIITQVEKAQTTEGISNIKKLVSYETRFRIKLYIDKKRDFRIGAYVQGKTIWFARILHRSKIYSENW